MSNFKGLAREAELVSLLSSLVAIESVNPDYTGGGQGEIALGEYVAAYLAELGIVPKFQDALPGRPNILGELQGKYDAKLIFEAHMDTVTLEPMPDALVPKIHEGRLYGRGACDDKASLAAMLYALKLLQEHGKGNHATVLLAATVGEEVGKGGVLSLIKEGVRANGAVVGEPTGLVPVIAHKGVERFRIRTIGRAAHTSRMDEGNNAIYQMVKVINTLRETLEPRLANRELAGVGAPTLCVSTIHGGLQVNIVPHECVIEIERRTVPGEIPHEVLREIDAVLDELQRHDPDMHIEREASSVSDYALDTPRGAKIAQVARNACEIIRGKTEFGTAPYGSDASKLAELGRMPSLVLGPGDIAQAHTADEWVEIAQVVQAAEIYAQMAVEFIQ